MLVCVAFHAGASATAPAVVGILQGSAVLVRDTSRFALAEGVSLAAGDILETAPDAFVQIELEDGTVAGLAGNGRLLFQPRLTNLKTSGAPQFYLLEGWLKVQAAPKAPAEFELLTPSYELATGASTFVTRVGPKSYEVFIEGGSARLIPRTGSTSTVPLRGNDFATMSAGADKPTVSGSIAGEFLAQLPRPYRDRLPARAAQFADRPVAPKPLAVIAYADVSPWLHSEPGVRLALSRQWRARAYDRAFRSELAANLSAHTEWERVLYPERFLPKPVKRVAAVPPKPQSAVAISSAPATRLTPIPSADSAYVNAPARAASAAD